MLQYEFGNRCDAPQTIDLQGVHVVGRTRDGRETKLVAYDPDAELIPLPIDGKSDSAEALAYRAPRGGEFANAWADVATIVRAPAPHSVSVGADRPAVDDGARPRDRARRRRRRRRGDVRRGSTADAHAMQNR